jgi:hypothetical protein
MTRVAKGYQPALAAALLHPPAPTPAGVMSPHGGNADRRFAVYRNNVATGLIGALEQRFPVVRRLVGKEFFRAMAQLYVELDPPRSPLLFRYGGTLPTFIGTFPPAASLPYLADVARLEVARGEAYHAADATPLAPSAFADLDEGALASTGIRLHPSATLLAGRFPFVSIWEANRRHTVVEPARWEAEEALIARPQLEVEVRRLPSGAYSFLSALSEGASLARAAAIARAGSRDFDPAAGFAMILESRIAIRLTEADHI